MRKILLAACAALAMTGVARGDDLQKYSTVGAWSVDKGDNACVSSASYGHNKTSLLFSINKNGQSLLISIGNEKWSIPNGKYEVRSATDDNIPAKFEALGDGNLITIKTGLSQQAIDLLSKGSSLHIWIGSDEYAYGLQGSAAMLQSLVACAGQLARAANPFAGQSSAPAAPVSTPSNPFKRT